MAPRYLTPRRSAHSYGPKILRVGRLYGGDPMPWQREAALRIGECDKAGRLLNPFVVVTVPRQSGKTFLMWATMTQRMMMRHAARVWYTAQTGIKAREQMWEMMDAADRSPLAPALKSKRGAGDTSLTLTALGSRIRAHPPTPDSLHGNQSDLNVVDEGWFFSEELAHGLMGAITPTQATRPNAQTIVVSTEGNADSTWLHDLIDRGRAGEPGITLIDYGIGPDVDPDDDDAIAAAHPAIGYTQDRSILETARAQLSPGEFIRAYGNRRTQVFERLIPEELVQLATRVDPLPAGRVVFGVAVAYERDDAAIVAASVDDRGVPWCEVIDRFPSAAGVADRLAQLARDHSASIVVSQSGPAAGVADEAERQGAKVRRLADTQMSTATTDILDRIRRPITDPEAGPGALFRAHPAFEDAFTNVSLRTSGDRVMLARRGLGGSVTALEAATVAAYDLTAAPAPVTPMIWS